MEWSRGRGNVAALLHAAPGEERMIPTGPVILLIDEDETFLAIAVGHFRERGYAVKAATGGLEGIEAAARTSPDVVVANMVLPGCSGFRVLEAAKRMPEAPSVIMVSSFGSWVQRSLARHLGASEFLLHPVSLNRLEEVVARLCPAPPNGPHLDLAHVRPVEAHGTA